MVVTVTVTVVVAVLLQHPCELLVVHRNHGHGRLRHSSLARGENSLL
jgi:hypothetical protein